ncbi:MAG: DUF6116 family protein [Pseudomonadota bacterium]
MANPLVAPILGFLSRLSFPRLFVLMAALFLVDTLIPDFIPFFDELILGMGTLLLASFRKRKEPATQAPKPPIEGERVG